jgi:nucleotide-binding universal stress UspA family protein
VFRRILIAADPDEPAWDAAPAAAAAVAGSDPEVRIVLVRDLTLPKARRDAGEEALEHLYDAVRSRGLRVRLERRDAPRGRVAEELAGAAGAFGADVVVLGGPRHGDLYELFKGSVGQRLAARLDTPLLIAGAGAARAPGEVRRVLVAVDGGEPSRRAVAAAISLAAPETEVTAIHVDTPVLAPRTCAPYQEALSTLRAAGVRTHGHRVASLFAGATIAHLADQLDADLVVLGSRRLPRVPALLLGSVAHEVVAHSRRTVLLAPSGARTEARTAGVPHPPGLARPAGRAGSATVST